MPSNVYALISTCQMFFFRRLRSHRDSIQPPPSATTPCRPCLALAGMRHIEKQLPAGNNRPRGARRGRGRPRRCRRELRETYPAGRRDGRERDHGRPPVAPRRGAFSATLRSTRSPESNPQLKQTSETTTFFSSPATSNRLRSRAQRGHFRTRLSFTFPAIAPPL